MSKTKDRVIEDLNTRKSDRKKSKLKWNIIWIAYWIPDVLLAVPVLLLAYALKPFGWLSDRLGNLKWYLVRRYKQERKELNKCR